MCETNNDDFQLRLRETLQTRELAAQNGFRFKDISEIPQDKVDALAESINSIPELFTDIRNCV